MTELKCPVCGKNLVAWMGREDLNFRVCDNPNCEFGKRGHIATIDTWQALIDTKNKLDVLQEFITKLYLNGNITDEQLHWLKRISKKDK